MHEQFSGIYDLPFKLTFTRCLRAATCIVPTASDLAPLHIKDEDVGLKLIARVCRIQLDAGEVKTEQESTSTCKHLIYQVLLSGMQGTLHLNKTHLRPHTGL